MLTKAMARTTPGAGPRWLLLVVGLTLSILMYTRSQVAGDQLNMLARGWLLVAEGQWVPFGLQTSAGGNAPGSLTALIVGLPLWFWQHHRAPTLLLLAGHLVGYLLLDRMIGRELGASARLLLAIVYWLNPWRVYHSGFLWNPNYLLPLGAVHLWTIYRQREAPRFWHSFLQVLSLGLAAQLHPSVVTLVILSVLLWWRGFFRLHLPGSALAAVGVALSLVPWALAVVQDPSLLPGINAAGNRLVQSAVSIARGLGYWVRYPAMIASSTILCLDFGFLPRTLVGDPIRQLIQAAVAILTVPAVVWANLRLWRRVPRGRPESSAGRPFQDWLEGVIRWSFVGTLLACALTPTAVMSWQLLTVLPLTVLPLVLLGVDLSRGGRLAALRSGALGYAGLATLLTGLIAFGSPMYRCGGETCGSKNGTKPPLRSDHTMLQELGIEATCPYAVNQPGGWWPDVLPEK